MSGQVALAQSPNIGQKIPHVQSSRKRVKKVPFALVEYFSSENYYQANSVSEQVRRLQLHADEIDRLIVPLVYHIDYTSYPGWTDPYADPSNTELQKDYALILKAPKLVAGQAVTNGHLLTQPGQMKLLSKDIEKMLKVQPRVLLKVSSKLREQDNNVRISYEVIGVSKSKKRQYRLFCAVSEDGIERSIKSGPNGGQTLVHYGLVRAKIEKRFSRDTLKGSFALPYPKNVQIESARLTCVVKDFQTHRSLAATSDSFLQ
jgi:hypothetical protein